MSMGQGQDAAEPNVRERTYLGPTRPYDEVRAEPQREISQVARATDGLEAAVEMLQKQSYMLEERLAPYLRTADEPIRGDGGSVPRDMAVPAAESLLGLTARVHAVAEALGSVRERFEG